MPLLHKKPFTPERPPRDLRPEEEVFVCKATREVFRDYEQFFNRHFLCNSYVWACSLTGQSSLTYTQAAASEEEAGQLLDAFSHCYQGAVLQLVHHVPRTNIRSLADELLLFLKERFVEGEIMQLSQVTSSGAKVLWVVKVAKVIPPDPTSPVRVSVISIPPSETAAQNGASPSHPLTNGVSDSPPGTNPGGSSSPKCFKTPKTPTPRVPLTPQAHLSPSAYKYVVEMVEEPHTTLTVPSKQLTRPKGQLNPKKLKLFLRNALARPSEKHPFRVKEVYVKQFDLGVSSVPVDTLPSPSLSARSSRKRSFSQASLDSFLSPTGTAPSKRSRPFSLDTSTPSGGKTKKGKKTKARRKSSGKSKTPSSGGLKYSRGTPKVSGTPRSPKIKTPRSQSEALKVLNKAKRFRQMDLKKSVVRKAGLSEEEVAELTRRAEEERRRWLEVWEEEKRKRREERSEKVRQLQEQKRLEKLRQIEMMRPREDTLVIDSKPLPPVREVTCRLPAELFGEAVMVLEFLHSFGPLFNIREVIREGVTFDKVERCLMSSDTDTILFDLVRFLVQAVLVAMEDDHENIVRVRNIVSAGQNEGEAEEGRAEEMEEGEEGEDETEPLDVKVESICGSSVGFAQWSWQTQRLPLSQLVVDPYTCNEVLRLHLLSSGGYSETAPRKRCRSYRRGGYSDGDNPAISLRLRRPDLLTALSRGSIYDVSPEDKLELLLTLCGQLLTSSVARDRVDESALQVKRARRRMRQIQFEEERRKRESRQQKARQQKARQQKEKNKKLLLGGGTSASGESSTPPTGAGETSDQRQEEATEPAATVEAGERQTEGTGAGETEQGGQETEEERKERVETELARLREELKEAGSCVSLQPLGSDRHHRRYWLFPNLPGLHVEDLGLSRTPDTCNHPRPASNTNIPTPSTFIENPTPTTSSSNISNTPPPVQSQTPTETLNTQTTPTPRPPSPDRESFGGSPSRVGGARGGVRWSCYNSEEEVVGLLAALDVRGVRERALKEALALHKPALLSSLQKMEQRSKLRPSPTSLQAYSSGDQYLELYLREQILDTEEKIHLGNLGHLRGNEGREEWRERIENSGAAAKLIAWREKKEGGEGEEAEEKETKVARPPSGSPASRVNPSVQALSQALLEVEAGIEQKFLMPPLGTAVDSKQRGLRSSSKKEVVKETDVCREQWRASLSQATSFSQIFVHLATLETAIMWSRSLMNVRCRICRRKGGDEYMLLCDGCDHGYHTYCLKPPLQQVPEEDWFCRDCSLFTPVKPRKRTQQVTFQEAELSDSEGEREEGENEDEDEEEGEEEEEEEEESEEEEVLPRHSLRARRGPAGKRRSDRLQKKSNHHQQQGGKATRQKAKKPPGKPVTKARKRLNMEQQRVAFPSSRAESVVSAIIELRCSRGGRGGGVVSREQRGLEMQLCEALWEEVNDQDCSWPFAEPVKKKEYPDYHDVVAEPIDLKTIRSKIKRGEYAGLDSLVADMNLLFSNCHQFHRKHSEIGRAGVALKKFFDKRCSDLGLKDLQLIAGAPSRARLRSSSRTK